MIVQVEFWASNKTIYIKMRDKKENKSQKVIQIFVSIWHCFPLPTLHVFYLHHVKKTGQRD